MDSINEFFIKYALEISTTVIVILFITGMYLIGRESGFSWDDKDLQDEEDLKEKGRL